VAMLPVWSQILWLTPLTGRDFTVCSSLTASPGLRLLAAHVLGEIFLGRKKKEKKYIYPEK